MAYMTAKSDIIYQQAPLRTRPVFVALISAACSELGITCEWSPDGWIARLTYKGCTRYIYGYQFPVNNATAAAIMKDKAATSAALSQADIAAVPHYLIRPSEESDARSITDYALTLVTVPLVVKPNEGTGGIDVVKCDTYEQTAAAMEELIHRHDALAVSPFVSIAHEYRVVVLHQTPHITFEKLRPHTSWQHNLALGSKPALITDETLRTKLEQLALQTMRALDANLASVDIISVDGELRVMEVNSGIMLNNFSKHSQQYGLVAHKLYVDILQACFD
jgi:glutathione synthase/RimK-type ligase-like ATP-grasp enzyme